MTSQIITDFLTGRTDVDAMVALINQVLYIKGKLRDG